MHVQIIGLAHLGEEFTFEIKLTISRLDREAQSANYFLFASFPIGHWVV
jgi:hypothetical protein